MPASQFHNDKGTAPLANECLLIHQVSEGNWDAYTSLFNYYLPKLSQYIYPFANQSMADTEEVIQEVFLKIWEKREMLLHVRSFDHYLFRMARNKLLDLIEKNRSSRNLHAKYARTRETAYNATEQSLLYAEYHALAQEAIGLLSPRLQTVFLLSSQNELSITEIADKLALPRETVKKRLYLASNSIKNYLRSHAEWIGLLAGFLFFNK